MHLPCFGSFFDFPEYNTVRGKCRKYWRTTYNGGPNPNIWWAGLPWGLGGGGRARILSAGPPGAPPTPHGRPAHHVLVLVYYWNCFRHHGSIFSIMGRFSLLWKAALGCGSEHGCPAGPPFPPWAVGVEEDMVIYQCQYMVGRPAVGGVGRARILSAGPPCARPTPHAPRQAGPPCIGIGISLDRFSPSWVVFLLKRRKPIFLCQRGLVVTMAPLEDMVLTWV